MKERAEPTLFAFCPYCDSCFLKIATRLDTLKKDDWKVEFAQIISELTIEGYNIRAGERHDYAIEYCEHIKEPHKLTT